jgi:hypothetical protein
MRGAAAGPDRATVRWCCSTLPTRNWRPSPAPAARWRRSSAGCREARRERGRSGTDCRWTSPHILRLYEWEGYGRGRLAPRSIGFRSERLSRRTGRESRRHLMDVRPLDLMGPNLLGCVCRGLSVVHRHSYQIDTTFGVCDGKGRAQANAKCEFSVSLNLESEPS